MTDVVTDIWFRSSLPLAEIARRLGVEDVTEDSENYWAWVIGNLGEMKLDITRTHTLRRWQADARIFLTGDDREFSKAAIAILVGRLQEFVKRSIFCGRWEYVSGNDFDLIVVREFKRDVKSDKTL